MQHTVNTANFCQHVYQQNKQGQQVKAKTGVNLILGHRCVLGNVYFVCAGMYMSVCVASVIHSDVAEQIGHGLSVVDAPDGLGQDHTDIHSFDFWTL